MPGFMSKIIKMTHYNSNKKQEKCLVHSVSKTKRNKGYHRRIIFNPDKFLFIKILLCSKNGSKNGKCWHWLEKIKRFEIVYALLVKIDIDSLKFKLSNLN